MNQINSHDTTPEAASALSRSAADRLRGETLHTWTAWFKVNGVLYAAHDTTKAKAKAKLSGIRGTVCPVPVYNGWIVQEHRDVVVDAAEALRGTHPLLDDQLRKAEASGKTHKDSEWFLAALMGMERSRSFWLKLHPTQILAEGPHGSAIL